jgi:hypothetical protein
MLTHTGLFILQQGLTKVILKFIFLVSLKILIDEFIVFNATFNNISDISWQSVLLVEETEIP